MSIVEVYFREVKQKPFQPNIPIETYIQELNTEELFNVHACGRPPQFLVQLR